MTREAPLKIRDHLPANSPVDLDDLIEAADLNATTPAAMDFVAKIRSRWDQYGEDSYLTEKQFRWLCELARHEL